MVSKVEEELKRDIEEKLMRSLTEKELALVSWIAEQSNTQDTTLHMCSDK
ncbi:hypothetical protein [Tuberibacillus calidus]|jgi:hypothetical protein|nr:hypothetical protein [Tuberibacillus calidus]